MEQNGIETIIEQLNKLMSDIKNVDSNLSIEKIPPKVLMLFGQTKAGKTTLMYYLLGKKLLWQQNEELGIMQMVPEAQFLDAHIGNGYQSATVYPNIPPCNSEQDVLLIDMPGFNDTRPIYRLLNIYIIRQILKRIKSVHISVVIPCESLVGTALIDCLEHSCSLFKDSFLEQPKCLSFILTKIEGESDRDSFNQQMQQLKQEYQQGKMKKMLQNYSGQGVYLFYNNEPEEEKGEQLKEKILSQNEFFPIDEDPHNLLSSRYAEIIIGDRGNQQFQNFAQQLLKLIEKYLPMLIRSLKCLIFFNYESIFRICQCLDDVNKIEDRRAQVKANFQQMVSKIHLQEIDHIEIHLNQKKIIDQSSEYLNFMTKFYRKETVSNEQFLEQSLNHLIAVGESLLGEILCFDKQIPRKIVFCLRYFHVILKTVKEINILQIQSFHNQLLHFEEITNAMDDYYDTILSEPDFLQNMVKVKSVKELITRDQSLLKLVLSFNPNIEAIVGRGIQTVSSYSEIKHKKMFASALQTSKNIVKRKKLQVPFIQSYQAKDKPDSIALLQILKQLEGFKRERHKNIQNLFQLISKANDIFYKSSMIEEAILLNMMIPDDISIEKLMIEGFAFKLIGDQFVKKILVPYFKIVSVNFSLIERCYNHFSANCTNRDEFIQNQKVFVHQIRSMRQKYMEYSKCVPHRSERINYHYLNPILENTNRIIEILQTKEKEFSRAILSQMKPQIFRQLKIAK